MLPVISMVSLPPLAWIIELALRLPANGDRVGTVSGGVEQEAATTEDGCTFCNGTNIDGVVTEVTGQVRSRDGRDSTDVSRCLDRRRHLIR